MDWAVKDRAQQLLPDVRNRLDITWRDDQGDVKLIGIIMQGMGFVQRLTSRPLEFDEGTQEHALLMEYCRYARDGALDEFSTNYLDLLLTFRYDEGVSAYAKKADDPPADV